MNCENMTINDLVGKKIINIEVSDDKGTLKIVTEQYVFEFYHYQECCEGVCIEDINGEWSDLIGEVCTLAEESYNTEEPSFCVSQTWTFYKFGSVKGTVVVRWLGESNGWYSESVDLKVSFRENV